MAEGPGFWDSVGTYIVTSYRHHVEFHLKYSGPQLYKEPRTTIVAILPLLRREYGKYDMGIRY